MAKAKKSELPEKEENSADGLHMEPRVYELGFHLDPELPQEEVKKAFQHVKDSITSAEGTQIAEGEPTKIQLAYTISISNTAGRRDFTSAFFAWIAYEADTKAHAKVTESAKANTRIIRFIDIKTDKEAAKHAEQMHELFAKATEIKHEDDEVVEAELDAAIKEVTA